MKTYQFHASVLAREYFTFEGKGETKEEALKNALATDNIVDAWMESSSDRPSFEDFDMEEATEVRKNK